MARTSSSAGSETAPASRSDDARARLLAAASQLFTEFGYEGTAVTRIAKSAGMTPANMYWHFPSKQDLLAEMLMEMYTTSYEYLISELPTGASAEARLAAFVRSLVHLQVDGLSETGNHSYITLATSLEPARRTELVAHQRKFVLLLRDILNDGVKEASFAVGDLTVTSFAILHMCEYSFLWYRQGGRLSLDDVEKEYVALVLKMVHASKA